MKQPMFRIAGFAAVLFTATTSFAQIAQSSVKPEQVINLSASISSASKDAAVMDNLKATNARLHERFIRRFPTASNITVSQYKNTTALYCKVDGIRNNVLFTNRGVWLHTVRYYGTDQLPKEVYNLVAQAFPEYSMLQVAEVSTPAGTAYLVDIEVKKLFKTIRVVDGDWDIYQQMIKQ